LIHDPGKIVVQDFQRSGEALGPNRHQAGPQLSLEVAFLAGNSIAARIGRDHIVTWDFSSAKVLQVIP